MNIERQKISNINYKMYNVESNNEYYECIDHAIEIKSGKTFKTGY